MNTKRLIECNQTLLGNPITITEFYGEEKISALSHYRLNILCEKSLELTQLIEKPLSWQINLVTKKSHHFHAIITKATELPKINYYFHYVLVLKPELWALSFSSNYNIYRKQTSINILEKLLSQHQLSRADLSEIILEAPQKPIQVQFYETDLDFINRIFDIDRLFYFFRSTQKASVLTCGDAYFFPKLIHYNIREAAEYFEVHQIGKDKSWHFESHEPTLFPSCALNIGTQTLWLTTLKQKASDYSKLALNLTSKAQTQHYQNSGCAILLPESRVVRTHPRQPACFGAHIMKHSIPARTISNIADQQWGDQWYYLPDQLAVCYFKDANPTKPILTRAASKFTQQTGADAIIYSAHHELIFSRPKHQKRIEVITSKNGIWQANSMHMNIHRTLIQRIKKQHHTHLAQGFYKGSAASFNYRVGKSCLRLTNNCIVLKSKHIELQCQGIRASKQLACRRDQQQCTHGEGFIKMASKNVFIKNFGAARQNDSLSCPDGISRIIRSVSGLKINKQPAAIIGGLTSHLGKISAGSSHVTIAPIKKKAHPITITKPWQLIIHFKYPVQSCELINEKNIWGSNVHNHEAIIDDLSREQVLQCHQLLVMT